MFKISNQEISSRSRNIPKWHPVYMAQGANAHSEPQHLLSLTG